jgi:pyruvate-ferredoxin/flavodoxin oxidoreductase
VGALTGRHYGLINEYKTEDADYIMVSMGTMADTALAVVDELPQPGPQGRLRDRHELPPLPGHSPRQGPCQAKVVAVVERTDEPAAADNPLTRELKSALADAAMDGAAMPRVISVSAGLGSRDIQPGDLGAVFDLDGRRERVKKTPKSFLGIRHPLALAKKSDLNIRPKGAYSLRGHSVGGFGSVTTNKLVATTVGELFNLYVQAYPRYGSEKKGLPTTYFLTIAEEPIRLHNELTEVDFVPLFDTNSFKQGNPLAGLVDGGTVFVPTPLTDPEEIWASCRRPPEPRSRPATSASWPSMPRRSPSSTRLAGSRDPNAGRGSGRRLPQGLAVRRACRSRPGRPDGRRSRQPHSLLRQEGWPSSTPTWP